MAAQRANVNLSYIMRGLMAVNREVTILFPRMFLEKKQGDAGALSCVEELGDPRSFHWEKTQEQETLPSLRKDCSVRPQSFQEGGFQFSVGKNILSHQSCQEM